MGYLDSEYFGNSLQAWLIAAVTLCVVYVALRFVLGLIIRRLTVVAARTISQFDDVAGVTIQATRWWYLSIVALWIAAMPLALTPRVRGYLEILAILVTLVQVGIWVATAIRAYVDGYGERRIKEDPASVTTIRALGFAATAAVWAIVLLVALDNLGVNVTAMVAGLGISGIAIALAVQNILGDLFASLSIVLDKPFVYGDSIAVDDLSGTVEKVGLKTTRVRSLTGEQLIFSNSDLLQSRIRNYKRMFDRRVAFTIRLSYATTRDQAAAVPGLIREVIEAQDDVRFDRAHFRGFGESVLEFEVVYFVLTADYGLHMDRQQAINLALMEAFESRDIRFGFPTRAVVMEAGVATETRD